MKISITFRCGHTATLDADALVVKCPTCGETVVSVAKAPPPTFRGAVKGPRVVAGGATSAVVVTLVAPEHALHLKPIEKES